MKQFILSDFQAEILCEGPNEDAALQTELSGNKLTVSLTARKSMPRFIKMRWAFESDPEIKVLGDAWERSYANLEFCAVKDNDRYMPWYFIADAAETQYCFGVKTQPNAFVSFHYDMSGITAYIDCQNGGCGIELNGRTIRLCDFLFCIYNSNDTFACLQDYCKQLCNHPLLPDRLIYGGNNWYYAYGKSDYETIVSDATLQAKLADGLDNRPYMVIDDGWQINGCAGPWLPNNKFRDMKALADEIKAMGVLPGIWIRPLFSRDKSIRKDMLLKRGKKAEYLDPTVPAVQELIRADVTRIRDWGYKLLKYDYTTYDLFGLFCRDFTRTIGETENWHFADRSKTNAEIVLDLYRLIHDAADDMLLIGCNTISHLCAGLVHINRTGDDTSGREWERTRTMGVNTLAFRLAQNNAFYMADADCVGILKDYIPWEKNRQWLDLLAHSDTALFVSCDRASVQTAAALSAAYREAQNKHNLRPLDWKTTRTPEHWRTDQKELHYKW
ncbi:MAG: hypothetical protein IKR49_10490 [Clostridia bacterium]|nr:hypothetical protein [Clostridia bacterium]